MRRPQLIIALALLAAGLACVHAQRPARITAPAALSLEVLARELTALGLEPETLDEPAGILRTRWQNLNFLYGEIDGREATLFRRYTLVVHRRPGDSELTLRADFRVCPAGTRPDRQGRLPARCRPLGGVIEEHQAELDALAARLEQALGRLRPSPEADLRTRVPLAVFELQAPPGLLPAGAAEQLTDYLRARLAATGWFEVVAREQMRAALRQAQLDSHSLTADERYRIELGRAVAARKLLTVQLIDTGGGCILAGTFTDLEREAASSAATVETGCQRAALTEALDQLARALVDRL